MTRMQALARQEDATAVAHEQVAVLDSARERVSTALVVRRLAFGLMAVVALLFFMDLGIAFGVLKVPAELQKSFNVTREDSLGNWFSCSLTLTIGVVLLVHGGRSRGRVRFETLALGSFFLYASADDGAKLHERAGTAFKGFLNATFDGIMQHFPTYTWHLLFGPLLAMVMFLLVRKLVAFDLPKMGKILLLAGLASLVVAVGLDFVEGIPTHAGWQSFAFVGVDQPIARHCLKAVEECLEMTGFIMILAGSVTHLVSAHPRWQIDFR